MKKWIFFLFSLLALQSCFQNKSVPPVYPVNIAEVKQGDAISYIEAIGNVTTRYFVQIRPQVTGILMEYYVKQGDHVKKNQPLLLIDPRPYEYALKSAEGNLNKDKATLKFADEQVKRNKTLVTQAYVSQLNYEQYLSQVDTTKGQILSDEAAISSASLNLEWTKPTSPIDGRVSQQYINPGNLVSAGQPGVLIDVREVDPAEISFNISQNDYVKVTQIKTRPLKFLAYLPQKPNELREGNIYFMDNHIDMATGTILFKGTIPNKDEYFLPGEFVRVKLIQDTYKNALLVPEQAVKVGQHGNYLYVYLPESSTVEYRDVVIGPKADGFIAIEKGITSGEKVVTQGQNNLLPGSKVKVVSKGNSDQKGHS